MAQVTLGNAQAIAAATQQQAAALARNVLPATQLADTLLGVVRQATASGEQAAPAAAPAPTHMPANPQALSSVQMLVAIAALSPQEERRKTQVDQARRGLDGLDQLHRELLSGEVSPATLNLLTQWVQDEKPFALADEEDPKFAALFHEIDLRVRVELAKFNIEV